MDLELDGQVAVVTGASKGIGRGVVKALALEGAQVFAVGREQSDLDSLKAEVEAVKKDAVIHLFVQDLQDEKAAEKITDAVKKKFDKLYLLVNNAGASQPAKWDEADDFWLRGMNLGFERPRQLAQKLTPLMIAGGSGRIVSITGAMELSSLNVAAVAKAALTSWTKGMSGALAKKGITVNCVAPGLIDSNQIRRMFPNEKADEYASANIPMGKFGEPSDIASMVLFLASSSAQYITGVSIGVDGGMRQGIF